MRTRSVALAVAALLLVAGCVGGPGGTDAPGTTTTADGSTTTDGPTTTTPAVDPSAVVAYEDLPTTAKEVFRKALERGELEGVTGIDSGAVRPLFDHRYVRYEGDRYRVRAQRDYRRRPYVHGATPVNGSPADGATVVAYENLSAEGREAFTTVLETDEGIRYRPEAYPFPGDPGDPTYVRYGNETYRLRVAHGHVWVYRFEVREATE